MKALTISLLLLFAACEKLDNKREVKLHYEGWFTEYDGTRNVDKWKSIDETAKVKKGSRYRKHVESNKDIPGMLATVSVDGDEVYREYKKEHDIDIEIR